MPKGYVSGGTAPTCQKKENGAAGTLGRRRHGHEPCVASPGNGAAIGGLKVTIANGWFASRPSGTEDVCKLYAESFKGLEHLHQIQQEARQICADACRQA